MPYSRRTRGEHKSSRRDSPLTSSFLGIVTTMIEQYAKFVKMALETNWRGDVAGLTYIETSTLWRQEHNGYSHQNPGLIGSFVSLPRHLARIYFPADANTSVSTIDHCLRSKNSKCRRIFYPSL